MARYYSNNNYRKRFSWKKFISISLAALLVMGVAVGGFTLFGSDTRSVSPTVFSVGGLDKDGEYVEQKNTIFTEDLIECQGLEITPDVKCTSTYKVYLYGHDKELISSTDVLSGNYKLTNTAVQYCRIMIIPADSNEEDYTIGFFDVFGIANQYDITVNRKQSFEIKNYFEADKADKVANTDLEYVAKPGYGASKLVSVSGVDELSVIFDSAQPEALEILFFTEDISGEEAVYTYVSTVITGTESTVATVTVPEGATHMIVNYELTEDFEINAK